MRLSQMVRGYPRAPSDVRRASDWKTSLPANAHGEQDLPSPKGPLDRVQGVSCLSERHQFYNPDIERGETLYTPRPSRVRMVFGDLSNDASSRRRVWNIVRDDEMSHRRRAIALCCSLCVGILLLYAVSFFLSKRLEGLLLVGQSTSGGSRVPGQQALARGTMFDGVQTGPGRRRVLGASDMQNDEEGDRATRLMGGSYPGGHVWHVIRVLSHALRICAGTTVENSGPYPVLGSNTFVLLGAFQTPHLSVSESLEQVVSRVDAGSLAPGVSKLDRSRSIYLETANLRNDIRQSLLDILKGRSVSGFQIPQHPQVTDCALKKHASRISTLPNSELPRTESFREMQMAPLSSQNMRPVFFGHAVAFGANLRSQPEFMTSLGMHISGKIGSSTGQSELAGISRLGMKHRQFHGNESFLLPGSHRAATSSAGESRFVVWQVAGDKSVCRTFHVCKTQNGSLLLPRWMKRHRSVLENRCGLRRISFVLDDFPKPGVGNSKFSKGDHRVRSTAFSFSNLDLFGISSPREHMPHFVADILKPLASAQVLMGDDQKRRQILVGEPSGIMQGTAQVGHLSDFLPTIELSESTLPGKSPSWVSNVARLLSQVGFEFVVTEESSLDDTRPCFRSLISNNLNQYLPYGFFNDAGQNIFFESNGLSREDVAMLQNTRSFPCTATLTALTRTGPRALLGLSDLNRTVQQMATRVGIEANFKIVDFGENSSFSNQVHVMQTTNVLIATHGAGNSNFIFMRPRAAVIEIFPFSYRAGPFNLFANIFGLHYAFAMAAPQTDVFKECMNRHERRDVVKQFVFSEWDRAVEMDNMDPGVHRLRFETEFGEPGKSEGMTTRKCARMQELKFDVVRVASMAVDAALQQCNRVRRY